MRNKANNLGKTKKNCTGKEITVLYWLSCEQGLKSDEIVNLEYCCSHSYNYTEGRLGRLFMQGEAI